MKGSDIIGITIVLLAAIGTIGGLALLLSAGQISTRLLKIEPSLVPVARSAISIGAGAGLATLFWSAATAIINGLNRFHITGAVKVASSILIILGTVFLVISGLGIKWVVLLNVVTSLLGFLILMWAAKPVLLGLRLKPVLHGRQMKRILRFCGYTSLSRFSYMMHFQAAKVIAGVLVWCRGGASVCC